MDQVRLNTNEIIWCVISRRKSGMWTPLTTRPKPPRLTWISSTLWPDCRSRKTNCSTPFPSWLRTRRLCSTSKRWANSSLVFSSDSLNDQCNYDGRQTKTNQQQQTHNKSMKNSIIIAQQVQSEDHSGAEQARQSLQGGSVGVHVRQISHQSRTRSGQEPQRPRHRPQSARQSETGRPAVHEAQEMKPALFLSSLPLVDTILIIMVASLSIRMKYIWCVFSTTINSFQFDENGRL